MKTRPACASETNDRVVSAVYETFKASTFDLRVQPSLFPRAESRDTEPGTVEMRGRRNDTQDTAVTVTNFCGAGYSLLTASTSTEQTRLTFAVVLAPDRRRRRHTAQTSRRRSFGSTTTALRDSHAGRHQRVADGRLRRQHRPAQRRARRLARYRRRRLPAGHLACLRCPLRRPHCERLRLGRPRDPRVCNLVPMHTALPAFRDMALTGNSFDITCTTCNFL